MQGCPPAKLLDDHRMHELHRVICLRETAFVIRTFCPLWDSMLGVVDGLARHYGRADHLRLLFGVRFISLLLFQRKRIFLAVHRPRGLITILFFQIQGAYSQFAQPQFNQGILLVII